MSFKSAEMQCANTLAAFFCRIVGIKFFHLEVKVGSGTGSVHITNVADSVEEVSVIVYCSLGYIMITVLLLSPTGNQSYVSV